jgi:hypothetical protein
MVAPVARSSAAARPDLDDSIGNTKTSRDTPERQTSRVERSSKTRTGLRQVSYVVPRNLEYFDRVSRKFLTRIRVTTTLV